MLSTNYQIDKKKVKLAGSINILKLAVFIKLIRERISLENYKLITVYKIMDCKDF